MGKRNVYRFVLFLCGLNCAAAQSNVTDFGINDVRKWLGDGASERLMGSCIELGTSSYAALSEPQRGSPDIVVSFSLTNEQGVKCTTVYGVLQPSVYCSGPNVGRVYFPSEPQEGQDSAACYWFTKSDFVHWGGDETVKCFGLTHSSDSIDIKFDRFCEQFGSQMRSLYEAEINSLGPFFTREQLEEKARELSDEIDAERKACTYKIDNCNEAECEIRKSNSSDSNIAFDCKQTCVAETSLIELTESIFFSCPTYYDGGYEIGAKGVVDLEVGYREKKINIDNKKTYLNRDNEEEECFSEKFVDSFGAKINLKDLFTEKVNNSFLSHFNVVASEYDYYDFRGKRIPDIYRLCTENKDQYDDTTDPTAAEANIGAATIASADSMQEAGLLDRNNEHRGGYAPGGAMGYIAELIPGLGSVPITLLGVQACQSVNLPVFTLDQANAGESAPGYTVALGSKLSSAGQQVFGEEAFSPIEAGAMNSFGYNGIIYQRFETLKKINEKLPGKSLDPTKEEVRDLWARVLHHKCWGGKSWTSKPDGESGQSVLQVDGRDFTVTFRQRVEGEITDRVINKSYRLSCKPAANFQTLGCKESSGEETRKTKIIEQLITNCQMNERPEFTKISEIGTPQDPPKTRECPKIAKQSFEGKIGNEEPPPESVNVEETKSLEFATDPEESPVESDATGTN